MYAKTNRRPTCTPPRIRTTANYSQLQPQALACQTLLPNQCHINTTNHESCNYTHSSSSSSSSSSLAAILTSSNGIILFPTQTPYEPSLILTHHNSSSTLNRSNRYSNSSSYNNYLSFSTQKLQHKLASIQHHSSHVLIWDTTGQSLQPLIARLPLGHYHNASSLSPSSSFVALDWNKHNDTIHTSVHDTLHTWDLRMNNYSYHRPSSTIITNSNNTYNHSQTSKNSNSNSSSAGGSHRIGTIISISSSYNQEHELACMDIHGIVHIYDDRMNQHLELCSFLAHSGGGIGIESIPLDYLTSSSSATNNTSTTSSDNTKGGYGYVTWGLEQITKNTTHHRRLSNESNKTNAHNDVALFGNSVKIWKQNNIDGNTNTSSSLSSTTFNTNKEHDQESYWYMPDTGNTTNLSTDFNNAPFHTTTSKNNQYYSCCSEISIHNLSSVRVCPKPFLGGLITVSTPTSKLPSSKSNNNDYNNNSSTTTTTGAPDSEYHWQIDLWRLGGGTSTTSSTNTSSTSFNANVTNTHYHSQELQKIASFCNTDDDAFINVMGESNANINRYLIATELTLGSSLEYITETNNGVGGTNNSNNDVELTICCLDSAGYITTYAIPEASTTLHEKMIKPTSLRNVQEHHHPFYFKQHRSEHSTTTDDDVNNMFHQSSSDPDLASKDIITKRGRGQSDADLHYDEVQHNFGDVTTLDHDYQNLKLSSFTKDSIEGGYMTVVRSNFDDGLFYEKDVDLDGDVGGLSQQQLNIQVHKNRGVDTNQELDVVHKDEVGERKIDPLKAMSVPCPRLCGAAFGVGGGIISFNNGEVKKMWHWFSSSGSPKSETKLASSEMKRIRSADSLNALQYFQQNDIPSVSEAEDKKELYFPRSLLGLMHMNDAAKFAQWGDENEDNLGESSVSLDEADSSDDDLSFSSSSSDDSLNDMNEDSPNNTADVITNYFGKSDFGLPRYSSAIYEQKLRISNRSRSDSFLGPTTESLVPSVFFTTRYDDIVLSGQSPELSDAFLLGESSEAIYDDIQTEEEIEHQMKEALRYEAINTNPPSHELTGFVIRNYNKFDPSFQITFEREKKKYPIFEDYEDAQTDDYIDEPECFIPTTYTSSIPQNRLVQRNQSCVHLLAEEKLAVSELAPTTNDANFRHLHRAREICIHNGKTALSFKQHRKADIWNLLAEILDNLASGVGDNFDGWKEAFSTGSFGQKLLKEILIYLEKQGDVQMLATIVSVIGTGKNRSDWKTHFHDDINLLLPSDMKRFDIYIHLYSNMLYSWGRIERSAEMRKHLTICHENVECLTFAPTCLLCERTLSSQELHSKICTTCNCYAFKCSICANPVRGLFTVCFLCGHGGHFDHVRQWFEERSVCPTGCGCSCKFMNTLAGPTSDTSMLTNKPEV